MGFWASAVVSLLILAQKTDVNIEKVPVKIVNSIKSLIIAKFPKMPVKKKACLLLLKKFLIQIYKITVHLKDF